MNWFWWIVIAGGVWWGINALSDNGSGGSSYTPSYSSSSYDSDEGYYDSYSEPENPYSEDESGHYAGYQWAEENGVDSCDGNSDSFIEGCEEYVSQRDAYEEQEEDRDYDY